MLPDPSASTDGIGVSSALRFKPAGLDGEEFAQGAVLLMGFVPRFDEGVGFECDIVAELKVARSSADRLEAAELVGEGVVVLVGVRFADDPVIADVAIEKVVMVVEDSFADDPGIIEAVEERVVTGALAAPIGFARARNRRSRSSNFFAEAIRSAALLPARGFFAPCTNSIGFDGGGLLYLTGFIKLHCGAAG